MWILSYPEVMLHSTKGHNFLFLTYDHKKKERKKKETPPRPIQNSYLGTQITYAFLFLK